MTLFRNKYRIESARLRGWNYASAGWYFVTLCTRNRERFFGEVVDDEIHLSAIGDIACHYWQDIPRHSPPNVKLDMFVIMPNHVHGIVIIEQRDSVETLHCNVSTDENPMSKISPKRGSLSAIIRSYKAAVTSWCRDNHEVFDWQPRFFDHIIREPESVSRIRQYIADNPAKWGLTVITLQICGCRDVALQRLCYYE